MSKFEDDIKSLDERIQKIKKTNAPKEKKLGDKPFVYAVYAGFRVGVELLSGVLIGAAIGYFLDRLFETKPLLMVIFLFFGSLAGFLNVYKFAKAEEKKNG